MNMLILDGLVKIFLILVIISEAFIITRRHILGLFNTYAMQSLLIAIIAFILFIKEHNWILFFIALITILSKSIFIPYVLKKTQKTLKISHEVEFGFLQPGGSIFVSVLIILFVSIIFSKISSALALSQVFYLGAILGLSLSLIGMVILFTRKQTISKIVGYLTMENGVVLFSLFISEIPFIIEIFILMDLIMLVMIIAILTFGINSTVEEFHVKLNPFRNFLKEQPEE